MPVSCAGFLSSTSTLTFVQGKTFLTSLIIDKLIEEQTDAIISYFYCRTGDHKSGEGLYLAILKSLLRQIISHNRDLLAALHDRQVNGRQGVEILDDEGTAKSLLDLLCGTPSRQFIIIDGLDEIQKTDRKAVINCLSSIVQKSDGYNPGRIRVLLVSTDLDDMRTLAKSVDYLDVYDIHPMDSQKDIDLYLKRRAVALKTKFYLMEHDLNRITSLISARSNGKSTGMGFFLQPLN